MTSTILIEKTLFGTKDLSNFVMKCRKQMFPDLNHNIIPKDLLNFSSFYIANNIGFFLEAKSENQRIGTIGLQKYDGRFPHLNIEGKAIAEVVKLFVEPNFRKIGLGTRLVNEMKKRALQQNVDTLYLHTHPFLDGAFDFWKKQGFELIDERIEQSYETLHMILKLK